MGRIMSDQDKLKTRELEVVRLMAQGLTNREIADRLYIGVETVRTYAKRIYSKLDVSGREEAADKAQSLGLLNEGRQPEQAQSIPKHNLPIQLTSFIGREQQISEIVHLLSNHRLVTLVGPGGSGKTRLSLEVAKVLLSDFDDGVYFVDLAPISESNMVLQTIAQILGVIEGGNLTSDILKRAIAQRRMLLILDNYEQVINACTDCV